MAREIHPARLPSLDGWRAVSIVMVLVCHSTYTLGFPAKPGGAAIMWSQAVGIWGVRFFFVISGFLITHLLLREHAKNGFISLKNFYLRRAIRILPVCYFYLFVLGCFTSYSQTTLNWVANLTFTTNYMIFFNPSPVPIPAGHLWSLGVEEQFYILWPFLLILILNRPHGVSKLAKILVIPLVVAPVVRVIDYLHLSPENLRFLFFSYSFFAKFDSLAYGCLAAVLFNYWRNPLETFCRKKFLAGGLGVLLVAAPCLSPYHGRLQAAGYESLQAMGFTLLLLNGVFNPDRGLNRLLNWKWVVQLGILSYSIYIWQQMFCGTGVMVFGIKDAWWTNFPSWIVAALLAACASYYLLEKPLLGLREKLRKD
jgi:peptidoglycan/LPS O-acetylase OafA/YrhL